MKKSVLLILFITALAFGQRAKKMSLIEMNYEQSNDADYYRKIKDGSTTQKFIFESGFILSVGDVFLLNKPNNQQKHTPHTYSYVFVGEYWSSMAFPGPSVPYNEKCKGIRLEIIKINLRHLKGRKSPIAPFAVIFKTKEGDKGTFLDIEKALKTGEILIKNHEDYTTRL